MNLTWHAKTIDALEPALRDAYRSIKQEDPLFIRPYLDSVAIFCKKENDFNFLVTLGDKYSLLYLPYLKAGDEIKGEVSNLNYDQKEDEITVSADFPDVESIPPEPVKSEKMFLEQISNQLSDQSKDIHATKNILVFFLVLTILAIFIEIIVSCSSHL